MALIEKPRHSDSSSRIISQGPNHRRYSDGTLEQWGSGSRGPLPMSPVAAPLSWAPNVDLGNFPIAYTTTPYLEISFSRKSHLAMITLVAGSTTRTSIGKCDVIGTAGSSISGIDYTWRSWGGG